MKGESSAPYKKRKVLEPTNESDKVSDAEKSSDVVSSSETTTDGKRKRTKSAKAEASDDSIVISQSIQQAVKDKRKSSGSTLNIIDSSFITQDQLAFKAVVSQKVAVWTPIQVFYSAAPILKIVRLILLSRMRC
jgi:hypothetical protein